MQCHKERFIILTMNYKKILERLNYWYDIDRVNQESFDEFVEKIAPNGYSPILENSRHVEAFLDSFDEDLKDSLMYYIYEAKTMKTKATIQTIKREYAAKNDDEFIQYLEDNF